MRKLSKPKVNDDNGYLISNLHNFTPIKKINSNHITTNGMAFPIVANGIRLFPDTGDYFIPGDEVVEQPLVEAQNGIALPRLNSDQIEQSGYFSSISDPQNTLFNVVPRPVGLRPEYDINGTVNPIQIPVNPDAPKMYEYDQSQMQKQSSAAAKKKSLLGNISKFIGDNPAQVMDFGLGLLNNSLYRDINDNKRNSILGSSDNLYASTQGSRGDWTTNEGFYQPQNKVVAQFQKGGGFSENLAPTLGMGDGLMPGVTLNMPDYVPRNSIFTPNLNLPTKRFSSMTPIPKIDLTADFKSYAKRADKYINSVKPDSLVTGEMLARGAQQVYKKTGKLVPVQLALAQLTQEGYLAKGNSNKPQRTKNPFDVGNTDDGSTVTYNNLQSGINDYYKLIANSYLKNKTVSDLLSNFTNVNNDRYATDPNYENRLRSHIQDINKRIYKEGGEYNLSDGEIQNLKNQGYDIEYV